ncbi:MAG: tetratricopeptide repeat protein [Rhodobacteraceae bacterium]|nr:tetratricopeptide repeat protein [Paracoccaceae bacterium]
MAKRSLDGLLQQARKLERSGATDAAVAAYRQILSTFPADKRARRALDALRAKATQGRGVAGPEAREIAEIERLARAGQVAAARQAAESMVARPGAGAIAWTAAGGLRMQDGDLAAARAAYEAAIAREPGVASAHAGLGKVLRAQGDAAAALACYNRALRLRPDHADALYSRGNLHFAQGDWDAAAADFDRAASLAPGLVDARNNLALCHKAAGRTDAAIRLFEAIVTARPDYRNAVVNLCQLLVQEGRGAEARDRLDLLLDADPGDAGLLHLKGLALAQSGDSAGAVATLALAGQLAPLNVEILRDLGKHQGESGDMAAAAHSFEAALALHPGDQRSRFNLGLVQWRTGQLPQARQSFETILAAEPGNADAAKQLGIVLMEMGHAAEARAALELALAADPDHADAHYQLGTLLWDLGAKEEGIRHIGRVLDVDPGHGLANGMNLYLGGYLAIWDQTGRSARYAETLGIEGPIIPPFTGLVAEDAPMRQLIRSERWARQHYTRQPARLPALPRSRPARLRIGYFTADIWNHATMHLLSGVLRMHDRERFEISAFSYGLQRRDAVHGRTRDLFDHFHDVSRLSDGEVVQLVDRGGLDIAVDLKGYTREARLGLFAERLAPLQIAWLGYPGTTGADFIDYMIADPVVIPERLRPAYSEAILYLPDCYQPNDDARAIADRPASRAEAGLPEEGFVFCSFNATYKITPAEFDIWMRLLQAVPGSVLWLLDAGEAPNARLREAAARRGVDADRLVFAPRLDQAEHLARQRHADLFLDSFVVNAHTTASDALWGGLPVLTKAGEQFAARVGASLVRAVGLPELVAETAQDYEATALRYATDADFATRLRDRLAARRLTAPLFDTAAFTRTLEAAYDIAFDRALSGAAPADLRVPAEPGTTGLRRAAG